MEHRNQRSSLLNPSKMSQNPQEKKSPHNPGKPKSCRLGGFPTSRWSHMEIPSLGRADSVGSVFPPGAPRDPPRSRHRPALPKIHRQPELPALESVGCGKSSSDSRQSRLSLNPLRSPFPNIFLGGAQGEFGRGNLIFGVSWRWWRQRFASPVRISTEFELGFPAVLLWVGFQGFKGEKLRVGNIRGKIPKFSSPGIERDLLFIQV